MKILSALQIREADSYTIKSQSINSAKLMERAGDACFKWIYKNINNGKKYCVICGTGNNGGDGLVIARKIAENKLPVEVIILQFSSTHSSDFTKNLETLSSIPVNLRFLKEGEDLLLENDVILIDAILGTGLNKPVGDWLERCIDKMNENGSEIISIDIASGLFSDTHTNGKSVMPNHTLTFQCPKLAFFLAENAENVGRFHVLDIGLDEKFIESRDSNRYFYDEREIKRLLKPRGKFTHKGTYGHGLLISGSKGKMGASVLAARACLRTGVGLLTVHAPECGYDILQTSIPEAMVETDINNEIVTSLNEIEKYNSIGIGPGIGKSEQTKKMFFELMENITKPIVVDADALNILSDEKVKIKKLPPYSILTPHPKEFERLAGKCNDDFERHIIQQRFSSTNNVIVVLKGAYTCITIPDGRTFFNSTGNPGMAKAGSGDVLTGMILALLCQGYEPKDAAILGVYLHGLAGDLLVIKKGVYSMLASDLIESIPKAFRRLIKDVS